MRLRNSIGMLILAGGPALYSGPSSAEIWTQQFTSSIAMEYDSNPALTPAYPGSVWRTLIDPGYSIMRDSGVDQFKAGVALQVARSSNDALSQSQNNPSGLISWTGQSGTGEWGLSSRFAEMATRDAGIDALGVVPADSTRTSRSVVGNWSRALDQRTRFESDATYERVSYQGGAFIDFSTQYAGLKISYANSAAVTTSLKISGDNYASEMNGLSSHRASAMLGAKWALEYAEFVLQAGRYDGNGRSGWLGGLQAKQSGQRYKAVLDAGRQISSGGREGFITDDQLKVTWAYALSELRNLGADFELRKNDAVGYRSQRATGGIWLQQNLGKLLGLKAYCQHLASKVAGTTGASSNTVGLILTYSSSDI